MSLLTAEEISLDELTEERPGRKIKMYALLLCYDISIFSKKFVTSYATDFTNASTFRKNRIYFDHCILKNNEPLDPEMVFCFDGFKDKIDSFLSLKRLPPATNSPSNDTYEKKILVEVNAFIKKYGNFADMNRAELKPLTKEAILYHVSVLNDQHLIKFLERVQNNCPSSWKSDLNRLYGFDQIIDKIANFSSQQEDSMITQPTFRGINNYRLMNENPQNFVNEEIYPMEIRNLAFSAVKGEEDIQDLGDLYDDLFENQETQEVVLSSSRNFVSGNDTNIIIPATQTQLLDTQHVLHEESPISGTEYIEYVFFGYSPYKDEPILINEFSKNGFKFNDSFEIYLKIDRASKTVYTLNFSSSGDINKFILHEMKKQGHKSNVILDNEFVKHVLSNINSINVPLLIHSKFARGILDVIVSHNDLCRSEEEDYHLENI
jgi:hypothetical protein